MRPVYENGEIKRSSFEGPSRFRKYTSISAMKSGEGSFRGIFGLSKTAEKSPYNGPSMREVGPQYYLGEEIRAARGAVTNLDKAVSCAQSFREKSTKLLEEAHRALGRLEQAASYRDSAPELIVVACEIKCAARRGITLVDVYGKYNTLVKVMTLFMRSYIHSKFDKQIENLKALIPPAEVMRGIPASVHPPGPAASGGGAPAAAGAAAGGPVTSPGAGLHSGAASSVASPLALNLPSLLPPATPQAITPPAPQPQAQAAVAQPLGRASMSHAANTAQPPAGPIGLLLRQHRHDRVHAMAYVPAAQAANEYVCIWWSAGMMLEFYSEATQSTTGFQIEKPALNVTALGIDGDGNVWTGHAKGMIRVRPKQQWEFMMEDKAFSASVRTITFDEMGRAWIGDDSGRIKVLGYESRVGRLETVASLQRSPALLAKMKGKLADTTRGLFGKHNCSNSNTSGQSSAASVFAAATAAAATAAQPIATAIAGVSGACDTSALGNRAGGGHGQAVASEGPVRCIFLRGDRAWTSGGRDRGWLQLWDANSFEDLDVFDCCGFGPCHAMAALPWPTGTAAAASSHHPGHPQHRHPAPGGPHRSATCGVEPSAPLAPSSAPGSWRLLTGHENGQLLLWHPEHKGLAPLLRIGEQGSPCRGIATFDAYHLIATGHQNGELHLFMQLTAESGLPPGAESVAPQSFGTLRPRMVTIQAHKSRVERMTSSGTSCVTASMLGTIRLWHAADLAVEAHRHGLLAHAASHGSLAAAMANGMGPPSSAAPMSTVPSSQGLGNRYSVSASDLQTPSTFAGSQFNRESAKQRLVSVSEATTSPVGNVHAYGSAQLVGACTMSTNLSTVLSPVSPVSPLQSQPTSQPHLHAQAPQQQPQPGATPGSAGHYHHARTGSKDSSDTFGGSVTQPSSAGTQLAEPTSSIPVPSSLAGPTGSFSHFQTIDASELSMKKLIGSGAYGKVWLAEWTGVQVAVKELFGLQGGLAGNDKEYGALLNEVTLLGSLSHPNIMRFLALCIDPPLIVMQYYPYGSLFDLLHRAQKGSAKASKDLSWGKRLDMLRDVAAGMQYLHSRKPPVIHGDLRSPNLLLEPAIDQNGPRIHVKIADFGLARVVTGATGSVMVSKTTNPRWLAPEVIKNSSVGKAADVYSFAIIMWEMLTWQQPYEDMMSVQVMFSTVTENSRPDVPERSKLPGGPGVSLHLYIQLMESCWHADATTRPSFKEIVECFQGMQRVEAENSKQQRQLPPGGVPQLQPGRRSRGPSETGGPSPAAPGSGGVPTGPASAEASPGVRTPGGSGSSHTHKSNTNGAAGAAGATAEAAAAAQAAARRAAGPAVASPFSGTLLPTVTTAEAAAAASQVHAAAAAAASPFQQTPEGQQYGSSLPYYGMSPILEEQLSSATANAACDSGAPSANEQKASSAVAAAGMSPFAAAAPQVHVHAGAGPTSPLSDQALQQHTALQQQQQQQSRQHHHHHHHYQQQPHHTQLGASPFAAGSGGVLATTSSIESGAAHPGSLGSNIAGAPSTTSSSRQSSTSTSGRAIGNAVAAVTTAMAAVAAAAPSGAGQKAGPGGSGGAAAPARQAGSSGTSTPRHDRAVGRGAAAGVVSPGLSTRPSARRTGVSPAVGADPSAGGDNATLQGDPATSNGGIGAERTTTAPIWETTSFPSRNMTSLSPFASLPPSQLGELDLAAPPECVLASPYAHTPGLGGGVSPFVAQPAAAAHGPAGPPTVGSSRAAATAAPRPVFGGSAATPSGPSGARGRIPGPAVPPTSHARPVSGLGAGTFHGAHPGHSAAPASRGTGATSHTQPGTPPYRGSAARGPSGTGEGRVAGGRPGSIPGTSSDVRRSVSGEGPSTSNSRTAAVASRNASGTDAASHGGHGRAAVAVSVAGACSVPSPSGRLSLSAAHAHIDGAAVGGSRAHEDGSPGGAAAAAVGAACGYRPGHRRTPSGGTVLGGGSGGLRTRDVAATPPQPHHCRDVASPCQIGSGTTPSSGPLAQPRTPTTAARTSYNSPRTSAPSSTVDSRPGTSRRYTPGSSASSGAAAAAGHNLPGSPSAPTSGHLSRLARPPASPRAYQPGGIGSTSANAVPGTSRIPSLSQGTTHGSPSQAHANSSTSCSLDDINLHRGGLIHAAFGLSAAASTTASPATAGPAAVAATTCSPFALTAAAWDDGLGVRHSPETTTELTADSCFRESAEYPDEAHGGDAPTTRGSADPDAAHTSPPPPPLPARISTTMAGASLRQQAAVAAWEPPPLLAGRAAAGGSPFAAAAYLSPFQQAADEGKAQEEDAVVDDA